MCVLSILKYVTWFRMTSSMAKKIHIRMLNMATLGYENEFEDDTLGNQKGENGDDNGGGGRKN